MNKTSKIITGIMILILIAGAPALYSYAQNNPDPAPQPMSLSLRAEIFWAHQKEVYEALGLTETQIQAVDEIINQERASCQPLLELSRRKGLPPVLSHHRTYRSVYGGS